MKKIMFIILLIFISLVYYNFDDSGIVKKKSNIHNYFMYQPESFIPNNFKLNSEILYVKYDTTISDIDVKNIFNNFVYKRYLIGMKIKNEDIGINAFLIELLPYSANELYIEAFTYEQRYFILEKEEDYKIISNNKKYIEDLKNKKIKLVLDSEIKDEKVKQFLVSLKK